MNAELIYSDYMYAMKFDIIVNEIKRPLSKFIHAPQYQMDVFIFNALRSKSTETCRSCANCLFSMPLIVKARCVDERRTMTK